MVQSPIMKLTLNSPLGLGLAALGRPGYVNLGHGTDLAGAYEPAALEARSHEVLDAAWAAGVRYFDTARSYGRGEEFLGNWLRQRGFDPQEVVVGSKWGYTYTANWQVEAAAHEIKEHSLAVLQQQWAETQAHLGPYLDLYQIHSATPESGVLDNSAVLGELARLKASGVAIGLSTSGPTQSEMIRRALTVKVDGVLLFDAVQSTWNLLEPAAGTALAEAHAAGLAVIVKEALANGRLTERNSEASFAPQLALLRNEAQRLQTSIDALCLAAVLAQPWCNTVLSGASTIEQLHSNLGATAVPWDTEADQRLRTLAEPAEQYWRIRRGLPWN
jgi:aryl-alcohol dehydrogenase-like predicted oxidoreductase